MAKRWPLAQQSHQLKKSLTAIMDHLEAHRAWFKLVELGTIGQARAIRNGGLAMEVGLRGVHGIAKVASLANTAN